MTTLSGTFVTLEDTVLFCLLIRLIALSVLSKNLTTSGGVLLVTSSSNDVKCLWFVFRVSLGIILLAPGKEDWLLLLSELGDSCMSVISSRFSSNMTLRGPLPILDLSRLSESSSVIELFPRLRKERELQMLFLSVRVSGKNSALLDGPIIETLSSKRTRSEAQSSAAEYETVSD